MSAVELVEHTVMAELLRGGLRPGERIRQDALAARLGVSKIPVREALQRLAANGLLRFESNRGAVVPTLTAADAEEHYALRRSIEPLLLERSLPRLTIVDLAEAELALGGDTGRSSDSTEANWRFHHALYRASGWTRGLAVCEMLHAAVAPYVVLYTRSLGGADTSDDQHRALLGAARTGDLPTALHVLEHHLDEAAAAVIEFLS
jgi:DNA-binding GntR family transcriptional regulator